MRHAKLDLVLQSLVLTDANWWDIAFRMPRSRAVPIIGYACVLPVEAKGSDKMDRRLSDQAVCASLSVRRSIYLWNKSIPQPPGAGVNALKTTTR